jgi:uncharacterized membrane protein YkgB
MKLYYSHFSNEDNIDHCLFFFAVIIIFLWIVKYDLSRITLFIKCQDVKGYLTIRYGLL